MLQLFPNPSSSVTKSFLWGLTSCDMQQIMNTYLQSNPYALLFLQHHVSSLTSFLYLLTSKLYIYKGHPYSTNNIMNIMVY